MDALSRLDITKLSFPALSNQARYYVILHSGAALGKGVGPLVIAKKMVDVSNMEKCRIAIPGENTTANFLLSYVFPQATNKVSYLFSEIEDAVLNGDVDLGVIIHENRFTYQQKGLHKICDLGEIWEEKEGLAIPLGCIAMKRSIDPATRQKVDTLIRKSVEYSFQHYPQLSGYVVEHAQAMEEEVMRKHIELYVNDYSKDLGEDGKNSIKQLYSVYDRLKPNNSSSESLFNHV